MSQYTFHCVHEPKKFRLTIDGGLGERTILELCQLCHTNQKQKFVIKEEMLDN